MQNGKKERKQERYQEKRLFGKLRTKSVDVCTGLVCIPPLTILAHISKAVFCVRNLETYSSSFYLVDTITLNTFHVVDSEAAHEIGLHTPSKTMSKRQKSVLHTELKLLPPINDKDKFHLSAKGKSNNASCYTKFSPNAVFAFWI
ncbi:hypothetical protein EGR_05380 [Echinococcus granulosus]|uniref:Uncharacterized protein n=1 Tax=Echinococcus granulosus TaxID=6210 RepID=W6UEA2_ECHGR|nr:hypothetical protein EGR_05380 [Echinococcus granulosus]EUB59760.1 hypothetical protein EGR_05380 [Echinococcus granulosus]